MRRPPRSTLDRSSAASDVYKRQPHTGAVPARQRLETGESTAVCVDLGLVNQLELATLDAGTQCPVSYTHLRAHETVLDIVCRLLLEKQKKHTNNK